MRVEVKRLKKYFGATRAVDDVSFSFGEGQIYGFVGPNGAGKTTTLRFLASLDDATDGDAYIDGVSVAQEPEKARRLVGFMPDTLPTHADITVHEYLDFFGRAYGVRRKTRALMLEQLEEFTNLKGIRDKLLRALSKGMKQRVSLARALVHDPSVLLLDEPAAGLDPRARIELRELLKALSGQGKAILISSHILTELAEIIDGAVFIEHGKLLRAGRLDEIAAQDATARLVQVRSLGDPGKLYQEMLLMPHVARARLEGGAVEAEVDGAEDACCDLLAELVRKGHRITDFRQRQAGLEEIFMRITKGEVQ